MRVTSLLLLQGRHLLFTTNISSISGSHHPCFFFWGLQLSGATAHERSQTHPLIFSLLSLWSSHLSPASWLIAFLPGLPNCASSTEQLERAFEHVNRIAFLLENTAVRAGGRAAEAPGLIPSTIKNQMWVHEILQTLLLPVPMQLAELSPRPGLCVPPLTLDPVTLPLVLCVLIRPPPACTPLVHLIRG